MDKGVCLRQWELVQKQLWPAGRGEWVSAGEGVMDTGTLQTRWLAGEPRKSASPQTCPDGPRYSQYWKYPLEVTLSDG